MLLLRCRPGRACVSPHHARLVMHNSRSQSRLNQQSWAQRAGRAVPTSDTESQRARPAADTQRTQSQPQMASVSKDKPRAAGWTVMGLDPSPELAAIALVYFVQGILGLARLAVTYMYKDEFGLDPATVSVLTGLGAAPWVVKPLYGFLSDSVPIFGYRRRSYLVLCGLLGAMSWTAMAALVDGPAFATAMMVVGSLGTACSDVVVDSIVVERSRGAPQGTAGSLQSLCWASAAVGGISSAWFSGSLVESWGTRGVFALTAVFPLLVSLSAGFIAEQRTTSGLRKRDDAGGERGLAASSSPRPLELAEHMATRLKVQAQSLWTAGQQRNVFLPAAFVFLWQATPSAETPMFYFYTNTLHFGPEFMGRVKLVGSVANLIGVATYNYFLKDVPLKVMFFWTAIIGTALGLTQLALVTGANRQWGIGDEIFVLGDSAILIALGQISFMPVLVLAARSCPEGVEATLFATLMSILNGGSMTGAALGAVATKALGITSTNLTNLAPLVLLCNLSSLLPLPLLRLLPDTSSREQRNDEEARPD